MIIRRERPGDEGAIGDVITLAFGRTAEAELVDELRAHDRITLSIVADLDGEIVGQVLFSPVRIETHTGELVAQAMGPVAVKPGFQGEGTGSAMISVGIEMMRMEGHPIVFVEGNPRYYQRFGFKDATPLGIGCEFAPPPGCFMVLELASGALDGIAGKVFFSPEFQSVG